jgi:phospholipid/cholesterol/gamma-HCH transport system ATP-binding protein
MIRARGLHKRFGEHRVLEGVGLDLPAGESIAIIGRSGGGKSVLLKLLIGLLAPDAGEVWIDGDQIGAMNERALLAVRRKFGMLFQGAALFDSLTVAENVGFLLRRERAGSEAEIRSRVAEALAMVELAGVENKMPAALSGGMRKRVGLARAIIHRPEIVLYDEPTTGLDPVVADSIDQLILKVCQQLRVTTVVVTHDMRSARRIGQRILLLHEGRIHAEGPPEAIFNSADPVVRRFVDGVSDPRDLVL